MLRHETSVRIRSVINGFKKWARRYNTLILRLSSSSSRQHHRCPGRNTRRSRPRLSSHLTPIPPLTLPRARVPRGPNERNKKGVPLLPPSLSSLSLSLSLFLLSLFSASRNCLIRSDILFDWLAFLEVRACLLILWRNYLGVTNLVFQMK